MNEAQLASLKQSIEDIGLIRDLLDALDIGDSELSYKVWMLKLELDGEIHGLELLLPDHDRTDCSYCDYAPAETAVQA